MGLEIQITSNADNISADNATFLFESAKNDEELKYSNANKEESVKYSIANSNKSSDIFALAKAFLSISKMTNKKLQKLCYYAKAWYLALYDCNLISEPFQAWVHGAVQPALYRQYRHYGYDDIPQFTNTTEIPEEFLSFANEIYNSYGHLTGDELEQINHQEEPWIRARGECKPWESCTQEISETDMKNFYRKMMV